MTDQDRWQWLANLKCNSLTLSRDDDHACNYVAAKQWIEEIVPESFADGDPAELQRMKDTNTIWALQIYPNTPVGFNVWYGATAESVIDQAMADYGATPRSPRMTPTDARDWQPISTAPADQWLLTYAKWDDRPVGVSRFTVVREIRQEVESQSTNRKGRRLIIQEVEECRKEWAGDHWEPTHWQPLPEPPEDKE